MVVVANLVMSFLVLPRLDTAFLAEPRWGGTTLSAVGGVWSVVAALAAAIVTLLILNGRRLPSLRLTMDAGDLDGDGDEDVVLGNFSRGPESYMPAEVSQGFSRGQPFMLLRNTRK